LTNRFKGYSTDDMFLSAVKSEVDSKAVYQKLANAAKNAFLKDRLNFLAMEEDKHRAKLEEMFRKRSPGKTMVLPDKTPVPMPVVTVPDENIPVSEIMANAMEAETAACEFYKSFAFRFKKGSEERKVLMYFSIMERGHFRLLENEKKALDKKEYFEIVWPEMNMGP
jgi:rubrerythrin